MTVASASRSPRRLRSRPSFGILALGVLLSAGAARAETPEGYLAARDRYAADIQKLDSDPSKQDAMFALDEKARADLKTRMQALLGPLAFKGLEKDPRFSPEALYEGDIGSGQPDGLVFSDKAGDTRLFVSPEPVFAAWLALEAKSDGADPRFREGVKAALASDALFTHTVGQDSAFDGFLALPVKAADGETVYAAVGLFSQDGEGDYPPNAIAVARLSNGRVTVAAAPAPEARKGITTCSQLYKTQSTKADQMMAAARKGSTLDDAKIEQAMKAKSAAVTAFRTCFAQEAPKQAFFAPLLARAEGVLDKMRGK